MPEAGYYEAVKNVLVRFYFDVYFMEDDVFRNDALSSINNDAKVSEILE